MSNISKHKVPHIGPVGADLLILGDAPGEDDNLQLLPFVGRNGEYLNYLLNLVGINRDDCRIAHVCNYQPKGNDFKLLHGSPQLSEGRAEIITYLREHPPKVILALGDVALNLLTGQHSSWKWRGSVLKYATSLVIPSIHPMYAFKDGQVPAILEFDLRKTKRILDNGYTVPNHYFDTQFESSERDTLLARVRAAKFISLDIESIRKTTHLLCIGVGLSGTDAVCIRNDYSLAQGCDPAFKQIVDDVVDAATSITFHNGLFDTEVLRLNGISIPNEKYDWDTMYAQRVIAPELPIGLDFCTSIYTDEPYYKDEGKDNSEKFHQTLWEYNCKDCITTYQIREAQEKIFESDPIYKATYQYQMSLIPVAQHLSESGMLVDQARVQEIKEAVTSNLETSRSLLFAINGEAFLTSSPKQVINFLHKKLGLPTRSNRDNKTTTNEDALVSLIHYAQKEMDSRKTEKSKQDWFFKLSALKLLLKVRGYEKLVSSYLNIETSPDGRVRSSYKISGTETGRWSASNYVDGSGFNSQTIPRESIEI
jgi:DNA polymerase